MICCFHGAHLLELWYGARLCITRVGRFYLYVDKDRGPFKDVDQEDTQWFRDYGFVASFYFHHKMVLVPCKNQPTERVYLHLPIYCLLEALRQALSHGSGSDQRPCIVGLGTFPYVSRAGISLTRSREKGGVVFGKCLCMGD